MEIKKFVCLKCGNCCKELIGSEQNNLEFDYPCFIGNGPVIMFSKPTLSILDWEKDIFPKEILIPQNVVFDMKSNKTIIFNFTLKTDSCPLLNMDNLCSQYEKRPISCKSFPHPYQRMESEGIPSNSYGLCKAEIRLQELNEMMGFKKIDSEKMKINQKLLNKNLYTRYGDTIIYQFLSKAAISTMAQILSKIQEEGKIKLAIKGYNFKYLLKRIENSEKVGISEFLSNFAHGNIAELVCSKKIIEDMRRTFNSL